MARDQLTVKLQRISEGLYWFGEKVTPKAHHALAGPFADRWEGYWWLVRRQEAKFTLPQRVLWGECLALAGGVAADVEHLVGIVGLIAHNPSPEYAKRCSRRIWDRKVAASGER